MNTLAVMCMALQRSSPSLMPLSLRHLSTSGVMLMSWRLFLVSNHSSFRRCFILLLPPLHLYECQILYGRQVLYEYQVLYECPLLRSWQILHPVGLGRVPTGPWRAVPPGVPAYLPAAPGPP